MSLNKKIHLSVILSQSWIGLASAIVDIGFLIILTIHYNDAIAFSIGFLFGTLTNYFLTIKYSFNSKHKIKSAKNELFFFLITYIFAASLQIIIIKIFYLFNLSIFLSKPVGVVVVFVFTLLIKWIYIFGIGSEKKN